MIDVIVEAFRIFRTQAFVVIVDMNYFVFLDHSVWNYIELLRLRRCATKTDSYKQFHRPTYLSLDQFRRVKRDESDVS